MLLLWAQTGDEMHEIDLDAWNRDTTSQLDVIRMNVFEFWIYAICKGGMGMGPRGGRIGAID